MAEAALTSIAKSALTLFSSLAKDEALLLWNSREEFQKLQETIGTIGHLLQDADKMQSKGEAVLSCLSKLRNVMYGADDLFDSLAYKLLRKKTIPGDSFTKEGSTKWVNGGVEEEKLLPDLIQHLSSLVNLEIGVNEKVRSIPKWLPCLKSLSWLIIRGCSQELKRRCEKEKGEDWPLISHINNIHIISIDEITQMREMIRKAAVNESLNQDPQVEGRRKIGWCGLKI